METKNTHTISVLFTRYHSTFSDFVYWISGRGYTHASIALDDRNECFYSFNFRGFCKEDAEKIKMRSTKSACFFQFVAEMLEMVDTLSLSKKAVLYFPNDLALALDRQMPVKDIFYLMN